MRKLLSSSLVAAVVVFGLSAPGSAEGLKRNVGVGLDHAVSVDPFGLIGAFGGILNLQYEHRMNKEHSWAGRVGFGGQGFGPGNSYSNIALGAEYRFWIEKHGIQGWYWGPDAAINILSITVKDPFYGTTASSSGLAIMIGAEGGYQYVFEGGFMLDGALGAGLTFGSLKAKVGAYEFTVPISGFGIYLRGGIGYAWK